MQDLSGEARFGPWATSQGAGNMSSSNEQAMTAPGSAPVEQGEPRQAVPSVGVSDSRPVGTAPSRLPVEYRPVPVSWKKIGD